MVLHLGIAIVTTQFTLRVFMAKVSPGTTYPPTLNTIINTTQSCELLQKFQGLLTVSQLNMPKQSVLLSIKVEMSQIKQHVLSKFIVYLLEGLIVSVKSVIKGMESHS
jgi:CHAT domain-containing protein